MTELLKNTSDALIANDVETLERLAQEAAAYNVGPRMMCGDVRAACVWPVAEVLRRQVLAASVQLATRRRLNATASLQADPWER